MSEENPNDDWKYDPEHNHWGKGILNEEGTCITNELDEDEELEEIDEK